MARWLIAVALLAMVASSMAANIQEASAVTGRELQEGSNGRELQGDKGGYHDKKKYYYYYKKKKDDKDNDDDDDDKKKKKDDDNDDDDDKKKKYKYYKTYYYKKYDGYHKGRKLV